MDYLKLILPGWVVILRCWVFRAVLQKRLDQIEGWMLWLPSTHTVVCFQDGIIIWEQYVRHNDWALSVLQGLMIFSVYIFIWILNLSEIKIFHDNTGSLHNTWYILRQYYIIDLYCQDPCVTSIDSTNTVIFNLLRMCRSVNTSFYKSWQNMLQMLQQHSYNYVMERM